MEPGTIFIVDDDAAVRESLALLLSLRGFGTRIFDSAEAFLAVYRGDESGCLVLDLRMGGIGGLALQAELAGRGSALPIIFVTAHGDVAAARAALTAGAVDFIEKPIDDGQLGAAIETALDRDRSRREARRRREQAQLGLARLTEREREVIVLAVDGRHNREIAATLGISARTVEVHKARAMTKLQVQRLPELVRLFAALGPEDPDRA